MKLPLARIVAIGLWFGLAAAQARVPSWAESLLTQNVSELGKGFRMVQLADIGQVTYLKDQRQRFLIRGAVRVMTEEGRARAACSRHYNTNYQKVLTASAWLVSADGRRTRTYDTTDFSDRVAEYGTNFSPSDRILTLSAEAQAEVGGAFIWEVEIESQETVFDRYWEFSTDTPTALCSLDVFPPPGGKLEWHRSGDDVPQPTADAKSGALHWEERNFRPPHTNDRPTAFLPEARFVAVRAIPENGQGPIRTWADMARLAHEIVEPRIGATSPELSAKAAALTAGKSARWDRIRALTEFVQKEITYLAVTLDKDCLAGYRPQTAGDVLKNRYGDCKDKATLLVAMLRAIAEDGRVMLLFAGNPKEVQPEWPSPRFNHAIVAIPADDATPSSWPTVSDAALGRMVVFDPTDRYTPLGVLPEDDQAGYGLIVAPPATQLVELPEQLDESDCQVLAAIDSAGNVLVKVVEITKGCDAAESFRRRDSRGTEKFKSSLEVRLRENLSSIDALHWNDVWNSQKAEWRLEYEFGTRRFGRRAGDLLLIAPQIVATKYRLKAWKTALKGVAWSGESKHVESCHLILPVGTKVEELPDPWRAETPFVVASVSYITEADGLTCRTELRTKHGFLEKSAYDAARNCFLRMEEAARRPIVLHCPE